MPKRSVRLLPSFHVYALALLGVVAIILFGDWDLTPEKSKIVGILLALAGGMVAFFIPGSIRIGSSGQAPGQPGTRAEESPGWTIRATGGTAITVLLLFLWFFAPDRNPGPAAVYLTNTVQTPFGSVVPSLVLGAEGELSGTLKVVNRGRSHGGTVEVSADLRTSTDFPVHSLRLGAWPIAPRRGPFGSTSYTHEVEIRDRLPTGVDRSTIHHGTLRVSFHEASPVAPVSLPGGHVQLTPSKHVRVALVLNADGQLSGSATLENDEFLNGFKAGITIEMRDAAGKPVDSTFLGVFDCGGKGLDGKAVSKVHSIDKRMASPEVRASVASLALQATLVEGRRD